MYRTKIPDPKLLVGFGGAVWDDCTTRNWLPMVEPQNRIL